MARLEPDFERTLRGYVLGNLDEASRMRLEEQLIRDPEAFEALGVIEDELTEEYLDGTLTDTAKRDFERHSLHASDRRRVPAFFSALRARATAAVPAASRPRRDLVGWLRAPRVPPVWLGAAAALLLVSVTANLWLARPSPTPLRAPVALAEPRPPLPASSADTPPGRLAELTAANQELAAQLGAERQRLDEAQALLGELERADRKATPIPTFALAASGLLRSGGALTRVVVPADAAVVRLLLDLPADDFPYYRVALEDVDGEEVWAQSLLPAEKAEGRYVVAVLVAAAALAPADYQMTLSGLTESGDREGLARYTFRVLPD